MFEKPAPTNSECSFDWFVAVCEGAGARDCVDLAGAGAACSAGGCAACPCPERAYSEDRGQKRPPRR